MSEFKKQNYLQSFNLIGEVKVNDYTFKIDESGKNNQDFVYNNMGLNVFCGEEYGDIYCEMMGGYNCKNPNKIYAHGRNEDGTDNFDDKIEVLWEDRNDESTLKELGDLCFIKVGLETENNKTVEKRFLSSYDAIIYIKDHLKNDMTVNIKGSLKHSPYNGNTQVKKEIKSIFLSKAEPKDYKATFRQTVLLTPESATVEKIDKEKRTLYIDAFVLDYVNGYKGTDYKGIVPLPYTYEYLIDIEDMARTKKQIALMFKVKKDVTEIGFEGKLVEGGRVQKVTYDDLDPDLKDLVDIGVFTEEEACAKYTDGSKERRMIITKPATRRIEEDGNVKVEISKIEKKYKLDDLVIDLSEYQNESDTTESDEDLTDDISASDDNDELDLESLFKDD